MLLSLLALILICSFFYNLVQRRFHFPSVVLLLLSGVVLQLLVSRYNLDLIIPSGALKLFGTLGLLIIVLEAVLDLDLKAHKFKAMRHSFYYALLIILTGVIGLSLILMAEFQVSWRTGLIYAVPLAITSSAIVIPSIASSKRHVSEFLILESVFSDIIGVLLFNFIIVLEVSNLLSIASIGINLIIMLLISVITSIVLGVVLSRKKLANLHVFTLASLVLIYMLAKHFNLSALLLIVIFGILLRNIPSVIHTKVSHRLLWWHLKSHYIEANLMSMQEFIEELGFIVRTIFFVLLGFSINLSWFLIPKVLISGILILAMIIGLRYFLTRLWFKDLSIQRLVSSVFPRGLISVLLLYQIPAKFTIPAFK